MVRKEEDAESSHMGSSDGSFASGLGSDWSIGGETSDDMSSAHSFEILERDSPSIDVSSWFLRWSFNSATRSSCSEIQEGSD